VKIEVINTGSELLIGTTLNRHGAWIGGELLKIGLRLHKQVTVSDGDAISEELERSLKENDVLVVTGGLGPTSDDLTREETAKAMGLELIEDEFAVRSIREFFASRGREMAECNLKQALCPCGADILPNQCGTAPGIYIPPRLGEHVQFFFFLDRRRNCTRCLCKKCDLDCWR
jgi:nicotinamide-nucleotide amidase